MTFLGHKSEFTGQNQLRCPTLHLLYSNAAATEEK